MPLARGVGGFTVTANAVSPTSTVEFGEMTAGANQLATHLTVGKATSGGGQVLFRLTITPAIDLKQNVTPRMRTTTTLTAVTS